MTRTDFAQLSAAIYSDAPPEIWEGDQCGPESPHHSVAGPLAKLRDEDAAPYARLFAAAPELLAALESMVDMFERHINGQLGPDDAAIRWDMARDAIAKATGR